jgi:hypothetical protein
MRWCEVLIRDYDLVDEHSNVLGMLWQTHQGWVWATHKKHVEPENIWIDKEQIPWIMAHPEEFYMEQLL